MDNKRVSNKQILDEIKNQKVNITIDPMTKT